MGTQECGPPASGGLSSTLESGVHCRQTAAIAIRAFIGLLQESATDGWVALDQVSRIGAAVIAAGGPLAGIYTRAESSCQAGFALATIEKQRTDYVGRLLTEPFAHHLDKPATGIERKHLPQYFAAIRMIIGDDGYAALKTRCNTAAERCRSGDGLVDWPAFFVDADCRSVLEEVVVSIARSFRRFEPRKDWFLIVMNQSSSSVSLGSNAFVPKKPEDKARYGFGDAQFLLLFQALFSGFHPEHFTPARSELFVKRWGSAPEKIIGPLMVELLRIEQHMAA